MTGSILACVSTPSISICWVLCNSILTKHSNYSAIHLLGSTMQHIYKTGSDHTPSFYYLGLRKFILNAHFSKSSKFTVSLVSRLLHVDTVIPHIQA